MNNGISVESFLGSLKNHPLIQKNKIEIRTLSQLHGTPGFCSKSEYLSHQLHLNRSEDGIFRSFHRTAVQVHIRKSLESGIKLRIGSSLQDVKDFYRIYITMRKELGLPPQPFLFFKNMWIELYPENHIELLLAEYESRVIAGMWVLKNRWLYSFEYLARAGKKDKFRSVHFLYWHGIKRALASAAAVVSFARTSARNTGLNEFKSRWGTEIVPYNDLIYPGNGRNTSREDQTLFKIVKKTSRSLPLPLFRMLGEIIYKVI